MQRFYVDRSCNLDLMAVASVLHCLWLPHMKLDYELSQSLTSFNAKAHSALVLLRWTLCFHFEPGDVP